MSISFVKNVELVEERILCCPSARPLAIKVDVQDTRYQAAKAARQLGVARREMVKIPPSNCTIISLIVERPSLLSRFLSTEDILDAC